MLYDVCSNPTLLEDTYTGFIKGNSFKEEYIPYEDMKVPKLVATTKEEELTYLLMMDAFRLEDLSLYLILHPECSEVQEAIKKALLAYQMHLKQEDSYVSL